MLAGTIVIEDLTITFKVNQAEKDETYEGTYHVTYTVCEGLTGEEETVFCHAGRFMRALGCALNFSGDHVGEYEELEAIQPINEKLRFIP
jgi:hypothetical protein